MKHYYNFKASDSHTYTFRFDKLMFVYISINYTATRVGGFRIAPAVVESKWLFHQNHGMPEDFRLHLLKFMKLSAFM